MFIIKIKCTENWYFISLYGALNPINKIFPILERSVISIHYTHMHYLPLYSRDLGMKKIVLTVLTGELWGTHALVISRKFLLTVGSKLYTSRGLILRLYDVAGTSYSEYHWNGSVERIMTLEAIRSLWPVYEHCIEYLYRSTSHRCVCVWLDTQAITIGCWLMCWR